ncbi:MAG: hypothetical protein ACHQ52_11305 [Candidatus Eisenbacteria bacterium]
MSSPPRPPAAAIALLAASLIAVSAPPASSSTIYNWANGAGGAATNTANWSPTGYPLPGDMAVFGIPATFNTSWAAPVDTMDFLWVTQGNPNFSIADRVGLTSGFAIRGISSLTISSGTVWASGGYANYSDLGQLIVDGTLSEVDAGSIDFGCFGGGGPSRIDVSNGGRLFCRGQLHLAFDAGEQFAGTIHHRVRTGFPFSLHYPVIYTLPAGGTNPDCVIGGHGSATLDAYDGGYLNTIGRLFIGAYPDGSGALHCYPGGGIASGVTSNGETWIGANATAGTAGGPGTVSLDGSFSYFNGPCWLGDPDDAPGGAVKNLLQMDNGAYTVFAGGLTMTGALTSRLDLIGGDTHVIGGPVTVKQVAPFLVGSAVGHAPTLWLENGTTTDIWPLITTLPALGVGRGGQGTVGVAGAGTVLIVHGSVAIGDSTGGSGTLRADSAATVTVQGALRLGDPGFSEIEALAPGTVVTVQDTVLVAGGTAEAARVYADSFATVHLLKSARLGTAGFGALLVYRGAQVDVAGLTLGPDWGLIETGGGGAKITVTDHLDLSGPSWVVVDSAGTLTYTGSKGVTVAAPDAEWTVNSGGLAQLSAELDVFGSLLLWPYSSISLASAQGSRPARYTRKSRPTRTQTSPAGIGGRLECPLVRIRGNGAAQAIGTIAGRFHIDSGTGTLAMSNNDQVFTGRLLAGDSTKTDGFISIGTTTIGLDTLAVLDADGGDLGKMTIAGGDLQLPKPGHLKSGFLLSGYGTVEGSLDVRDSAWVSLRGQVTGDVSLAGTLDTGPTVAALVMGSLHPAATGVTTVKIGHTQQDLLVTTGAAALAGTLDLRGLLGDTPVMGDTFTVLVGAVSGTFANVRVNGHPATGTAVVLYSASEVRVAIVGAVTGVGDMPPVASGIPGELRFASTGGPRDAALALDLPVVAQVRVALYDVGGRQVGVLADSELGPGRHRFEITRMVTASGMYFARAVVTRADGTSTLTTRAVVLR